MTPKPPTAFLTQLRLLIASLQRLERKGMLSRKAKALLKRLKREEGKAL